MIVTVGDTEAAWFEVGRGAPVVLIHGLADDHRAWRRVIAPLMLRRRVILYDLRGHGGSSLGNPAGTLAQLGTDLIGLLDALEVDQAILAGFSLGGTIAMRAAIDNPDRVAALALVATSSRVNSAARDWYLERAALAEAGESVELRQTLDRDTEDVYRRRPAEIPDGVLIRRQSTADPLGYANACRAMAGLNQESLDDELAAVDVETVVLAGEDDQHCPPRAGEIIASGISGSELTVLPGAGHPLPVEFPDEVATAILGLGEDLG
ncbi:MAG TPA: alpha/beta fold hydrolase [Solirubrobacterales bacterium]